MVRLHLNHAKMDANMASSRAYCNGPTSLLHLLTCGHTVKTAQSLDDDAANDASTETCRCLTNCAQQHASREFTTGTWMCIQCTRLWIEQLIAPRTQTLLETLLKENPAAELWSHEQCMEVVQETMEYLAADAEAWLHLNYSYTGRSLPWRGMGRVASREHGGCRSGQCT